MPVIFDLYAKQKMGVQAVAKWLNQNGHRTHAGRRWSSLSVLSVLRNEVYRGQILFRSGYHPAPHTAIVGARLFESVQEILKARGESMAKRRTNLTDYTLGGLLTCGRCGGKLSGTAAHGRSRRCRYYTCLTRQKYGEHDPTVRRG